MNWIRNFVKPKLKALVSKDVPEKLWDKCPSCEQMIFHRELSDADYVCPQCDYHMRIGPVKRLELLFDGATFERIPLPAVVNDPLKFKDIKRYSERKKEAQGKTKEEDALVIGFGKIGGKSVVCAAFNFQFMGGSMGLSVGEGLVKAADYAREKGAALIVVPASGGARMQEGILSLMQMARSTAAISKLKESRLPYIVLLTDPTTGGVTASFAMLGDIHIAEPKAMIGFAGRRVIEQTIKQKLPDDFQTAEYLLDHGMLDQVVHRKDLNKTLGNILSLLLKG
ncbi:MAG: acetyl-CoA carboxylase carboxyltransferase subunit beta [Alphaproteobacteria bacterium]|nr:acetyl-CoA carboxylase carboxyltransferase subunit beta [Alphaproteobacteria bacterium]NCQ66982.1 acetyl-CoA carboxylase carboxyltransferase subunit beta [Alphaproteobacteria bacterium]NCT07579.1 acetyl-CoA carboxylase carboxyltransferase subunit beta [Alphaproteobacteria bacterium]